MAVNFKVSALRRDVNLDVNLSGDFDSASAYTLLNVMLRNIAKCDNATINTNGLGSVENCGVDVFTVNARRLIQNLKTLEITGRFKERFHEN